MLREVVPGLRTLAILANISSPNSVPRNGRDSGGGPHDRPRSGHIGGPQSGGYRARVRRAQGPRSPLYVCGSPLLTTNRIRINTLALGVRLPTVHGFRELTEAGGLMSYGPNFPSLFRRAAEYVDKILRGAKPSDLPVEQPTQFDFVLNLTTAKALGLTVPPSLLARADEVIE
jgi:putative tryptophan/tyrosine transport system substrate-binding protein